MSSFWHYRALEGGTGMKILKCLLMIVTAPVVLVLTLFVWLCTGLIYISGLVLGLLSMVIALLGVAVLITYSPQNGVILLVMAFLISPMGLPLLQSGCWARCRIWNLRYRIGCMGKWCEYNLEWKRSRTMGDETQCPASWLFGMNGSVFLIFAFGFVWKHHFKFTRR